MAKFAQGYVLVVLCASMLGVSVANWNWQYGWKPNAPKQGYHSHKNATATRKIVVGGSANWTFGFDYADWARKNGPFCVNDTLVFKYDLPKDNTTHPHSVYLLPNLKSFSTCNLTKAVKVADADQGRGEGFELKLKKPQPYYIVCGGGDGVHCNLGKMKFYVLPILRRFHY